LRSAGWRWLTVVPEGATLVQEGLRDSGVDVIAASLPRFRRSLIKTASSLLQLPSELAKLAAMDEVQSVDIVQAVGGHHPHGALLAAKLRKPLVWQLHSSIMPYLARRIVAPIIDSRSDAIMTNGRKVAAAFWGRENIGPDHFVFYAPVDIAKFRPDPEARAAARAALGYGEDSVVVGTVGNRVWQKNHELLVGVAAKLAGRLPNLKFCVLGAPSDSYRAPYAEKVEAPAAALNIKYPGYFQFVAPGSRVDHWIHALDIFTFTSHAEGVPIALFEAMCAAKPVVSVRVGSIDEIVLEGETGLLCPAGDGNALGQAYLKLAENEEMRRTFGVASSARIRQSFSIESVVSAHVDAYERALKNHHRA
jgi:glycosyltransferase involved in cell wall biosynthesis